MAAPRGCVVILQAAHILLAQEPQAILNRVDALRHPWPAFSVDLCLEAPKLAQRWRVYVREGGDVRVEGLSEKEKGRSVLIRNDDMWILAPGSRRPVKVTPQQRLMGPATGGDLARLRFAEDYTVQHMVEAIEDGKACWWLTLTAKRPSQNYRTTRLCVAQRNQAPLKAEFLLPSGKLAKRMRFAPIDHTNGIPVIAEIQIEEPSGASATLRFEHWNSARPDSARFELPSP